MSIGSRIYELRKNAKLSQEKLAEQVGVTRQTISNWELNESSPDIKQARELSSIFSVSLDELVDNDIKDILLDKTNKSNDNMNKLNRIMLGVFLTMMAFFVVLVLILISINKSLGHGNTKDYSKYRSVMAICEINDEAVFFNTPASDFVKIKKFYESNGGKCYDREHSKPQAKD